MATSKLSTNTPKLSKNALKLSIKQLDSASADFDAELKAHLKREMIVADAVTATVSEILSKVRARGDAAVLEYTNQFDGFAAQSMADLKVTREQMQASLDSLDTAQREALEIAANRIREYHERQKQESWQYREEDGSLLGQKVSPLQRVGVYAPGGKANYPSSILMLAIPAQVAGVEQIIATVPYRLRRSREARVRRRGPRRRHRALHHWWCAGSCSIGLRH
jgi:histidinol dehydrogenase